MKLILGPMATLTHEALRTLIHRFGDPDEYFSEMIHAPSLINGGHFESWYIRTAPCPEKMVWQLTGPEAPAIAEATRQVAAIGGLGVDINMGCSAPDIARTGAGIAWMLKSAPVVADLIHRVRSALDAAPGHPLRLSVKLRLGADENYPRLLDFCRLLVSEGVELITLHPRTKTEKLRRSARWQHVAALARDLSIPVYGNGDVSSAEKALEYQQAWPCSGIMIARAAVKQPWIFRDIRSLEAGSAPASEKIDHLELSRFFLSELAERQPPEFQLSRAQRFFSWYCQNFSFAHHVSTRIQNANSPEAIGAVLEEYFSQMPEEQFR